MSDIIFICNANMCRSPMAEGILKKIIAGTDNDKIKVSSMGIHGFDGNGATDNAITVCEENDISIKNHRSRPLIPEELKQSRVIFAMEMVQVDFIDIFFPQVSDRLYMLGAWPQRKTKKATIADPVGKSIEAYRKTFNILKTNIERVYSEIVQ